MLRAKSICLLLLLFVAVLLGACSDSTGPEMILTDSSSSILSSKVIVDSSHPLVGQYKGRYNYITGYGGPVERTWIYDIQWKFSGRNYWMTGQDYDLCEPWGQYVVTDVVELIQKDEGDFCAYPERNPTGTFSLRQAQDSVIMMQVSGDVCKLILLVPADSDTPDY